MMVIGKNNSVIDTNTHAISTNAFLSFCFECNRKCGNFQGANTKTITVCGTEMQTEGGEKATCWT